MPKRSLSELEPEKELGSESDSDSDANADAESPEEPLYKIVRITNMPISSESALIRALEGVNGQGNLQEVESAIRNGESPDTTYMGLPILLWSLKHSYLDLAKLLIALNCNVNITDDLGNTALHYASRNYSNQKGQFDNLVHSGARLDARNNEGMNVLHISCTEKNMLRSSELIKLYNENDGLNWVDSNGMTALHHALTYNNINTAKLLIKTGSSLSIYDYYNNSPLKIVLNDDPIHWDLVFVMLEAGADIEETNSKGESVLHQFISAHINTSSPSFSSKLNTLLKLGADVNRLNSSGENALEAYLKNVHLETFIIQAFMTSGVNINNKTKSSAIIENTLVREDKNCWEIIKLLIDNNADANTSIYNIPLISFAIQEKENAVIQSILESKTFNPTLALSALIDKKNYDHCMILLENGADLSQLTIEAQQKWHCMLKEKNDIEKKYTSINPDNMVYGPLNKNIETLTFERLAKYMLRNPGKYKASIESGAFCIRINDTSFNITSLLKNLNCEHIQLSEEDSKLFMELFNQSYHLPTLPDNYLLPNAVVTEAEGFAIHSYTCENDPESDSMICYMDINQFLHRNIPDTHCKSLDRLLLTMLFLASGMNKIRPEASGSGPTFRGERFASPFELHKRTELVNGPLVSTFSRFTSTSETRENASEFDIAGNLICLHDRYGKNIQPFSSNPNEMEYLIPPSPCLFTLEDRTVYMKPIRPLVPLADAVSYRTIRDLVNSGLYSSETNDCFERFNRGDVNCFQPLSGLLDACQYVYDKHLSLPYTSVNEMDRILETKHGIIHRPNHGLAHTMRVAYLIPVIARILNEKGIPNFDFSHRNIALLQIASLFFVAGRQDESSYSDNSDLYLSYRAASASAFYEFSSESPIAMTAEEVTFFTDLIKELRCTEHSSSMHIVSNLAHKLDLLRCYNQNELQKSVYNFFERYGITNPEMDALIRYAKDLLNATGDRIIIENSSYRLDLFYAVSTDPNACLSALSKVPELSFNAKRPHL